MILSQSLIESELKTINEMIRICIECGSKSIDKKGNMVLCKKCNSKFRVDFKRRSAAHV